jgi:hypothetical protein
LAHHFGLLIALLGEMDLLQQQTIERSFPSHQQVSAAPIGSGAAMAGREFGTAVGNVTP